MYVLLSLLFTICDGLVVKTGLLKIFQRDGVVLIKNLLTDEDVIAAKEAALLLTFDRQSSSCVAENESLF